MVEVVFLGVGAALPMPGQTNCAYVVRTGDLVLLVDCGPAILQQLAAAGLSPGDVTHLYLSHRHGDHILGYPLFLLWWSIERPPGKPLPLIVASDVTWPSLDALRQHTFGDVVTKAEVPPRLSFPAAEPAVLQLNDRVTARTWPMQHSTFAPVSGLRLEVGDKVLAFTSDTAPCDNILPVAQNADLLVIDAAYSAILNPEWAGGAYGHGTAQTAGRYAAQAGAKQLALVHLNARYQGQEPVFVEEATREFAGTVLLPRAGATYTI